MSLGRRVSSMRPRAALLVLLVVLAGCAGPADRDATTTPGTTTPSPDATTSTLTATTAETVPSRTGTGAASTAKSQTVTTDTATTDGTPTPGTLAPGVTEAGVENASALVEAHLGVLVDRGFEHRVEERRAVRETGTNATRRSRRTVRAVATAGLSSFRFERSTRRSGSVAWSNGSVGVARATLPNGSVRYDVLGPEDGFAGEDRQRRLLRSGFLRKFLRAGDYRLADWNRSGGRTLLTLRATGPGDPSVESFRGTVVVDARGVVHRLNATLSVTVEDREVTRHVRYLLGRTGVDGVPEPAWLDEAVAATNATATAG